MLIYMWNINKIKLKYVRNMFKTVFFYFTLDFRRLIAHRWRHVLHLYVILLLNFDSIQIRTDLWSASSPTHWLNFDPVFQ